MNCTNIVDRLYYYVLGKEKRLENTEIVDLDKINPIIRDTLILFLKDNNVEYKSRSES